MKLEGRAFELHWLAPILLASGASAYLGEWLGNCYEIDASIHSWMGRSCIQFYR